MLDSFGDRMKFYEGFEAQQKFIPMVPIVARIDGRGFSKFTQSMARPYNIKMSNAMIDTTKILVEKTNALIGYTQSDEITLIWHSDDYDTKVFFDGKKQKMVSVLASLSASAFINSLYVHFPNAAANLRIKLPHFDTRVWQVPEVEAANVFLWRVNDAVKNAISMAASSMFSHKSLQNLSGPMMQEKMFQEKGINFNDYPSFFKEGTFVRRAVFQRQLTPEELLRIPEKHRSNLTEFVTRSEIRVIDMPRFNKVSNRTEVILFGAEPLVKTDK